jgi:GT2 family glycosyltransferase
MTEDDLDKSPTGFSVVVPTRGRVVLVGKLLKSLHNARDQYPGEVEILIVDDSTEPDHQTIKQLCADWGDIYIAGGSSVRAKRNLGVEQASHKIILFVDSDCEVQPDIFIEHARCYQEHPPAGLIGGGVGITEFIGKDCWMWEVIEHTQFLNAFSFAKRMQYAPWATCSNTSFLREAFIKVGGFDTEFPFRLGGDDVDLGIRMNQADFLLKCNPAAIVTHTRATWLKFFDISRRAFRWGGMDVHLYFRKHNSFTTVGMPKFGHIFLLLIAAAIFGAIIFQSGWLMLLPLVWSVLALFIRAVFTVLWAKKEWRFVPIEFTADLLGLFFEAGFFWEGFKYRVPAILWRTVRRGPMLPIFEQVEEIILSWGMWLSALIVFCLFWILIAGK